MLFIAGAYVCLVGHDVDQSAVDSTAVFLFELFVGNSVWSVENQKEIRNKLGPFPASVAEEAYRCVLNIIAIAPHCKELDQKQSELEPQNPEVEFGKRIKFRFPKHMSSGRNQSSNTVSNDSVGVVREGGYDSLSDDDEGEGGSGSHSELLTDILCQPHAGNTLSKCSNVAEPALKPPVVVSSESLYSAKWLQAKCLGYGTGADWKDLFSAIFDYLSSGDEDIENNVSV